MYSLLVKQVRLLQRGRPRRRRGRGEGAERSGRKAQVEKQGRNGAGTHTTRLIRPEVVGKYIRRH